MERLERALHVIDHLREQLFVERQAMWGGLMRALSLEENPMPLQDAAAAVSRCARWQCCEPSALIEAHIMRARKGFSSLGRCPMLDGRLSNAVCAGLKLVSVQSMH
jgi:hypothetical protein